MVAENKGGKVKKPLKREKVDLATIVDEVCVLVSNATSKTMEPLLAKRVKLVNTITAVEQNNPPDAPGSAGGSGSSSSSSSTKKKKSKKQQKGFPVIEGDSHALTQVLFNLVTNACKFCKKGSIRLTGRVVTASAAKKDNDKASTKARASRRGSGADAGDGGSATAGVGVGASAGAIQQFVEIDVKDTGTVSGSLLSFLSSFVLPGVCVRVNLHHLHFL